MRPILILLLAALAGCAGSGVRPTGPAGQPSVTNVNPETGSRGGTNAGK